MGRGRVGSALSSLTAKLLVVIIVYVAVLMASFLAVNAAVNARLDNGFPTLVSLSDHQDALENDRFNELTVQSLARCEMVIFDSTGQQLFASSREAARDMPYSLASSLDSLDALEESNFAGLENCFVERLNYTTDDGQARVLVMASPMLTESAYEQIVNESNRLWLLFVLALVLATIAAAVAMARIVRRAVAPLDDVISSYKGKAPLGGEDDSRVCTELVSIHDNFIELMELLQSEKERKQQLMADISHDLKTPLTVINGYARALLDDRAPEESRAKYLSVIVDRSVAASHMLDDLSAYSKMDHPMYQVVKDRVDVLEEVVSVVVAHRIAAEDSGCLVELDVRPDSAEAIVDRRLLNRALSNLLGNAIRHNPGERIGVSCACDKGRISIQVANTGSEIPADIKARIFDPFVTGDAARTSGSGSGLGLSITKKCMELNDGCIRLLERPPEPFVTAFVCELPMADDGVACKPAVAPAVAPDRKPDAAPGDPAVPASSPNPQSQS